MRANATARDVALQPSDSLRSHLAYHELTLQSHSAMCCNACPRFGVDHRVVAAIAHSAHLLLQGLAHHAPPLPDWTAGVAHAKKKSARLLVQRRACRGGPPRHGRRSSDRVRHRDSLDDVWQRRHQEEQWSSAVEGWVGSWIGSEHSNKARRCLDCQ